MVPRPLCPLAYSWFVPMGSTIRDPKTEERVGGWRKKTQESGGPCFSVIHLAGTEWPCLMNIDEAGQGQGWEWLCTVSSFWAPTQGLWKGRVRKVGEKGSLTEKQEDRGKVQEREGEKWLQWLNESSCPLLSTGCSLLSPLIPLSEINIYLS